MLLIDAYNLLHTDMPATVTAHDEASLCEAVANSKWRAQRVVVVCDGLVKPHGPAESPAQGVELIYSGSQRTADDVIIEMIDADSSPRRLLVVSSDRQIQKAARRRKARSWTSERFIAELAKSVPPTVAPRRRRGPGTREQPTLSDSDVDAWAKEFDLDLDGSLDLEGALGLDANLDGDPSLGLGLTQDSAPSQSSQAKNSNPRPNPNSSPKSKHKRTPNPSSKTETDWTDDLEAELEAELRELNWDGEGDPEELL